MTPDKKPIISNNPLDIVEKIPIEERKFIKILQNKFKLDFKIIELNDIPNADHGYHYNEIIVYQNRIIEINLYNQSPRFKIPKSIGQLKNLKVLYLHRVAISSFPREIEGCTELEELILIYSGSHILPNELGNLPKLKRLIIMGIRIQLPSTLGNIKNLQLLSVYGFDCEIPHTIENCINLVQIEFTEINVDDILIKSLSNLSNLRILRLNECKIRYLPNHFFKNLSNLTELSLTSNNLYTLPSSLSNCRNLENLNISHNKFLDIPLIIESLPNLQVLDVSGCNYLNKSFRLYPPKEKSYEFKVDLIESLTKEKKQEEKQKLKKFLHILDKMNTNFSRFFHKIASQNKIPYQENIVSMCVNYGKERILMECEKYSSPIITYIKNTVQQITKYGEEFIIYSELQAILELQDNILHEIPVVQHLDEIYNFQEKKPMEKLEIGFTIINAHVDSLWLINCNLNSIPKEIFKLRYLHRLNLSKNQISTLDSSLIHLNYLKCVDFSHNRFKSLPLEIFLIPQINRITFEETLIQKFKLNYQLINEARIVDELIIDPVLGNISMDDHPFIDEVQQLEMDNYESNLCYFFQSL